MVIRVLLLIAVLLYGRYSNSNIVMYTNVHK